MSIVVWNELIFSTVCCQLIVDTYSIHLLFLSFSCIRSASFYWVQQHWHHVTNRGKLSVLYFVASLLLSCLLATLGNYLCSLCQDCCWTNSSDHYLSCYILEFLGCYWQYWLVMSAHCCRWLTDFPAKFVQYFDASKSALMANFT